MLVMIVCFWSEGFGAGIFIGCFGGIKYLLWYDGYYRVWLWY
jgi:hypothetical protein